MVIVSLALHQANTIQAHIASFSKINSLDPGSEEIMIIEENIEPENLARRPKFNEPSRSFSHLYDNRWNQDHPKMMKKMIKRMEMEGDDQYQTNPIRKRQNNGGAIVPYKGGRVAAGGAGGAGKKRFGKGAKVAAGVGGAVALGGVVAGAVHLAKNKRELEEVQMIKRNGKRGGRRKRIAAQERAREGTNVANQKAGTTTPKTGMGKGKAAMLVAGGAAAGAAVMHTVGNSKGGGGDPNAAAAAVASQ